MKPYCSQCTRPATHSAEEPIPGAVTHDMTVYYCSHCKPIYAVPLTPDGNEGEDDGS
jgi:hypothetical protein